MSQTLTLICRDRTFEYAPSAIHLEKTQVFKTESSAIETNKIKLSYRANTFEYIPQPPLVLSYYRESRPINWRFCPPPKNKNNNFFLFILSVLTWKNY
jgi:hypothetical protein